MKKFGDYMLDFEIYTQEILEFVTKETLEAIDWGILDWGHVKNYELKRIFLVIENVLTLELEQNYLENRTGIFRVSKMGKFWYYKEFGITIKAESLEELEEIIAAQNRIWYIFDEDLFNKIRR